MTELGETKTVTRWTTKTVQTKKETGFWVIQLKPRKNDKFLGFRVNFSLKDGWLEELYTPTQRLIEGETKTANRWTTTTVQTKKERNSEDVGLYHENRANKKKEFRGFRVISSLMEDCWLEELYTPTQ